MMLVTSNIIHEKNIAVKGNLAIIWLPGMTARVLKHSLLPGESSADAWGGSLANCSLIAS